MVIPCTLGTKSIMKLYKSINANCRIFDKKSCTVNFGGHCFYFAGRKNTAQTEGTIKKTGFVVTLHAMIFLRDRHFRLAYLSSSQNEFVSNSGSTSVAFMIRAATTALHIAVRCWVKPPLHQTRKHPLLSDSVSGGGQ